MKKTLEPLIMMYRTKSGNRDIAWVERSKVEWAIGKFNWYRVVNSKDNNACKNN